MIGSNAVILVALGSIALLLLFLLAWSVLMLVGAIQRQRLFKQESIVTQGEVVDRQIRRYRRGQQYFIAFRFTAEMPDGQRFLVDAWENTWLWKYERLVEGTAVAVEYVPRKPELARLSPVQNAEIQAAH